MKLLELIDQIGNIGNRADIEGWRTEMKAEAAKIEVVVRAAEATLGTMSIAMLENQQQFLKDALAALED